MSGRFVVTISDLTASELDTVLKVLNGSDVGGHALDTMTLAVDTKESK